MSNPEDPIPQLASMAKVSTVADVVAEWWQGPGSDYSERGREAEQFRRALLPLLRLYGDTPAAEFGVNELEEVQKAMASGSWMTPGEQAAARTCGWCRTTLNRHVVRIRTVWRWADRKGFVPRGSWAGLLALPGLAVNNKRVRHPEPRRQVTLDEIRRVAEQCWEPVRTMLLLQELAGMRSAEVRLLRSGQIDRTEGDVWWYRPPEHKCDWRGHTRTVPLGPECQRLLEPHLRGKGPDEFVFPALRGRKEYAPKKPQQSRPYSVNTYPQAVRRAALAAGVPDFAPYDCRHHAKQRITREKGLEVARATLGHKSIQTTDGYGDATDQDLARRGAR